MTAVAAESAVTEILVNNCGPHPLNRKRFDPAKLKELAESIAQGGLWTPILVRPDPDQVGHYQIVAGERRWRAHQQLERTRILAIVRELTDEQAIEALVVENAQREDPHPLEEADGYAALMDVSQGRITVPELAARVGKSASYILQRLKLRELGDEGRAAFWENRIPFSHALVVARLPKERQGEALAFAFESTFISFDAEADDSSEEVQDLVPFRSFADRVRNRLHLPIRNAPFPIKDATLYPAAGSCISCPKRTGFTPDLFPELGRKADECTDRDCWDAKGHAFLERAIAEARAKHGDALVLLSGFYGRGTNPPKEGKPLVRHFWTEAKKTDAGAVPGLIVDEWDGDALEDAGSRGEPRGPEHGKVTWVKVKRPEKAKSKATAAGAPPVEDWQAKQKREEAARAIESARRLRLVKALLPKVSKLPKVARACLLFETLQSSVHNEELRALSAMKKRASRYEFGTVAALSESAYAKEAVLTLAADEVNAYGDRPPTFLLALAKELKVDAKKVMADPPAPKGVEKPKPAAKAKGKK